MLSNNRAKFIHSLQQKKYRQAERLFVVEGGKSLLELLDSSYELSDLLVTPHFYRQHEGRLAQLPFAPEVVEEPLLLRLGSLQSNDAGLAVVHQIETRARPWQPGHRVLVLDEIRDPGNLGTILRLADWYGLDQVVCSPSTVEFYNPKVLMATMGSFTRVVPAYVEDLAEWLAQQSSAPIHGAVMEGESVHARPLEPSGILVIGNESQGISAAVQAQLTRRVTIPRKGGAESLNAALATGILLDRWVFA